MITKKYYKLVKVSYEDEGYLYIKNVDSTAGTLTINGSNNLGCNIEYSTDGVNWTTADSNAPFSLTVPVDSNVYLRGTNSSLNEKIINMDVNHTVGGNVLSIIDKTNFNSITSIDASALRQLFYNNVNLIGAGLLSFGNLTTIGSNGLALMFSGCSNLLETPETLPASTLGEGAYFGMFKNCPIEIAPKILATSITSNYVLQDMFYGCSSLNNVTCMIVNDSGAATFDGWLNGVSSTGTFYKSSNSTLFAPGQNGIPSGWTVVDA